MEGISVFNIFTVELIERLQSQATPVLLEELSGISQRTWRNRLKEGWEPTLEAVETLRRRIKSTVQERLVRQGDYSEQEALRITQAAPSHSAEVGLPTADLIYWNSPGQGDHYAESITVAKQFDLYCLALLEAVKDRNLDRLKQVLLQSLSWLRACCQSDTDLSDADDLEKRFGNATDIAQLLEEAKPLAEQLIFHVFSCWDVEFCATYFDGAVAAYPLFELLMPRLALSIEIEAGTGRFLRDGKPPGQKVFEKSMSRLLDFTAVLAYARENKCFPEKLPKVRDMVRWFKCSETQIVSWRDETTWLSAQHFSMIWKAALGVDEQGNFRPIPWPMYVAAFMWSPFLVREKGKPREWYLFFDSYELAWKRNLDRLTAKGLKFGNVPWPSCLTYQPLGNRSPDSWRCSQSSGRSSQPLDCQ
jgi:hypothetical protein